MQTHTITKRGWIAAALAAGLLALGVCHSAADSYVIIPASEDGDPVTALRTELARQRREQAAYQSLLGGHTYYSDTGSCRQPSRGYKDYSSGYSEGRNDASRVLSAKNKKERRDAECRAFDADKNYSNGTQNYRSGYEQGYMESMRRCNR